MGGLYNTTRENFAAATGGVFFFFPFPFFPGAGSRRDVLRQEIDVGRHSAPMMLNSSLFFCFAANLDGMNAMLVAFQCLD